MGDDFWRGNFGLVPETVNEADVWRAAHQMLKTFPEDAAIAAAQRADKALEMGDIFNFNLWSRITKAVGDIERQKPGAGDAIN